MTIQVSNSEPNWIDFKIDTSLLIDETSFLQIGNAEETEFFGRNEKPNIAPSGWNTFPTKEDPNSLYKFTSVEITVNPDLKQIKR